MGLLVGSGLAVINTRACRRIAPPPFWLQMRSSELRSTAAGDQSTSRFLRLALLFMLVRILCYIAILLVVVASPHMISDRSMYCFIFKEQKNVPIFIKESNFMYCSSFLSGTEHIYFWIPLVRFEYWCTSEDDCLYVDLYTEWLEIQDHFFICYIAS